MAPVGGTTLGSGWDPRDPTRQRNSHHSSVRALLPPLSPAPRVRLAPRALGARSTWGQAGPAARRPPAPRAHDNDTFLPVLFRTLWRPSSGAQSTVCTTAAAAAAPACGYEVMYIQRYKWERAEFTRRCSGKELATSVLPPSPNSSVLI